MSLHSVHGKKKELFEVDPMKLSIGAIEMLDEQTKVFPGERDGHGTSEALRKRNELIKDQFNEFVGFSL